ncbi:unnamed protein product [Lupinus luteus]|uniref:Uncharacterized protein n=1 Tax=Lupinus luteus TaxID=3873 RepID=A0AAV1Y8A5_LUPLU
MRGSWLDSLHQLDRKPPSRCLLLINYITFSIHHWIERRFSLSFRGIRRFPLCLLLLPTSSYLFVDYLHLGKPALRPSSIHQ